MLGVLSMIETCEICQLCILKERRNGAVPKERFKRT